MTIDHITTTQGGAARGCGSLAFICAGNFQPRQLAFRRPPSLSILSDRYKLPPADPESSIWRHPRPLAPPAVIILIGGLSKLRKDALLCCLPTDRSHRVFTGSPVSKQRNATTAKSAAHVAPQPTRPAQGWLHSETRCAGALRWTIRCLPFSSKAFGRIEEKCEHTTVDGLAALFGIVVVQLFAGLLYAQEGCTDVGIPTLWLGCPANDYRNGCDRRKP